MYRLGLLREFTAEHFLIGGDWGAENERHAHHYRLEVNLEGNGLDEHGYLLDLVKLEDQLDALMANYQEQLLNDLPEFEGLNPSLEHFSRILASRLAAGIRQPQLVRLTVKLWEDESAWASYRMDL